VAGSSVLQECGSVTCTHALAIHRHAFAKLLEDIPVDYQSFEARLDEVIAFDQYLVAPSRGRNFPSSDHVTTGCDTTSPA
jgi:hypothetical protein